ncbi:MAG TPA: S8 family serine peptidase [Lysobacter sp.]
MDRQLLVMLPVPPPHFRPDTSYAGGYQSAPGRDVRRRLARKLAREHDLSLLEDWPMPDLGLDCFVMQAASPDDKTRALPRLSADPRVAWAQPMQQFQLLGANDATGDPLFAAQPAAARWHLRELHALAGGKSVTVAQIDSGVELSHPDLRGQVAQARSFVGDDPFVAEAHGTEIAGIVVAREHNGIGIAGIAPRTRLLALRACWQPRDGAAACSSFTLAQALQFALQKRAQILNLSLSGPRDRLLERLLDVALSRGVIVVGAVDARAADGGFPAAHPGVLAVASHETGSPIAGALLAPGQGIPTTTTPARWNLVSGSSYAAAQVTGLVALLRELSPRISSTQLRDVLVPAPGLGLATRRPQSIDACAAVARVSTRCACDCAVVQTMSSMPRR